MLIFETILVLLVGATALSAIARHANIPYPTLLAIGGAAVALIPGVPALSVPPELILALFVAPILLDAAYDTSLRDLRANWRPVTSLVLVAVGLTTLAVAVVARLLMPEMPWAAAVALGALVAPPDAVAALAVLRQVDPPHRIRKVLEGESLLNDASALLIYRLAVVAMASGGFSLVEAAPAFVLVAFGSVAAGWLAARIVGPLLRPVADAPTSVILQFVTTFGIWLLAEHFHLSAVVTIVVFGLTIARGASLHARLRVASFAVWEAVTFVLNVLAFTLIGLQLGPILERTAIPELIRLLGDAVIILLVVMLIRLVWVMAYTLMSKSRKPALALSAKGGLVVGWSGMRGIVTLAAALALPAGFPDRDFIQLAAFVVVLGTLVVQGLTLRPLLALLKLPKDHTIEKEVNLARGAALKAAMNALRGDDSPAAQRLRLEYQEALSEARQGHDPRRWADNALRQSVVPACRTAIDDLRDNGTIGDDAYRRVEEELDWLELSSRPAGS